MSPKLAKFAVNLARVFIAGFLFGQMSALQTIVLRVNENLTGVSLGTNAAGNRACGVITPPCELAVDRADHSLTRFGFRQ